MKKQIFILLMINLIFTSTMVAQESETNTESREVVIKDLPKLRFVKKEDKNTEIKIDANVNVVQNRVFYYFPDWNIYLDPKDHQYIYNDGKKWVNVSELPHKINLQRCPKGKIMYDNASVWQNNTDHRRTFLTKKQFDQTPIVWYKEVDLDNTIKNKIKDLDNELKPVDSTKS